MRGRCAPDGADERAPAGAGVCATASDIAAANDTATRLVLTVNDFTDMAFCFALGLRPPHGPASRGVGQLRCQPRATGGTAQSALTCVDGRYCLRFTRLA